MRLGGEEDGYTARMPGGGHVAIEYERDLDLSRAGASLSAPQCLQRPSESGRSSKIYCSTGTPLLKPSFKKSSKEFLMAELDPELERLRKKEQQARALFLRMKQSTLLADAVFIDTAEKLWGEAAEAVREHEARAARSDL